jgi:Gpi18-like mannosyltransferase
MVRIALTADDSFAAILERSKFGTAMAATIKMIVTTIKSSTSENPFSGLFMVTLPNFSGFLSRLTHPKLYEVIGSNSWAISVTVGANPAHSIYLEYLEIAPNRAQMGCIIAA